MLENSDLVDENHVQRHIFNGDVTLKEKTEISFAGGHALNMTKRLFSENLLPGESAADRESLGLSLLAELKPKTAYEGLLAGQLFDLEWDLLRYRRLRDDCCRGEYRMLATNVLTRGAPNVVARPELIAEEDRALLHDLTCSDDEDRSTAEQLFLRRTSWMPSHLLTMAIGSSMRAQAYEDRIADLERRRRLLRKDYDELMSSRRHSIEEAEILE